MGWIPEGWECGRFGDISKHVKNGVKAEDVADYDFYIGLEHIGKKQIFLSDNGSGESIESNKSGFEKNDLLFGKLRPYFHKVCIVPQEGICSTDILVFRPGKPEFRSYMYLTAYTEAFVEYANMHSTGTRMPRASAKDMLDYVITIPSGAVLNSFEAMVGSFWEKGMEAVGCSRALAKLRDTLLPKLLSGELRIPDAEKLTLEAI
jgi:type I restriction enzyme S subunit